MCADVYVQTAVSAYMQVSKAAPESQLGGGDKREENISDTQRKSERETPEGKESSDYARLRSFLFSGFSLLGSHTAGMCRLQQWLCVSITCYGNE